VAYSCKSVLWAMEGALIARRRFALKRERQQPLLKREFADIVPPTAVFNWNRFLKDMGVRALSEAELEWVAECIEVKKRGFNGSRIQAIPFCWKCLVWVLKVRFWTTFKDVLMPK
jgi:hypothetical protein